MFEEHQVIFAENVPSESFYPGPMALKAMQPLVRMAFASVLPALGRGDVTRQDVIDHYGPTARDFMSRKALKLAAPVAPMSGSAVSGQDWMKNAA